jgi:hypothetical protein
MYALYKQQMGDKFDAEVINQALYDIKEASGFLRVRELQRTQEKDRTPWFCPTGQTPFDQCQQHIGKDAFSLGVVTQTETLPLQLPDSMKVQLGFFGKSLGAPMVDLQDRADTLIGTVQRPVAVQDHWTTHLQQLSERQSQQSHGDWLGQDGLRRTMGCR